MGFMSANLSMIYNPEHLPPPLYAGTGAFQMAALLPLLAVAS
jgi:hypothetical protein